nr:PREDICTED: phospholipase A1 member A isoform X2 [Latimeria chalumnae]|eukprot:XP_014346290.1 PREDICTED: phospholipase A1 member A isoform X2 [Latimeria chalumnae]
MAGEGRPTALLSGALLLFSLCQAADNAVLIVSCSTLQGASWRLLQGSEKQIQFFLFAPEYPDCAQLISGKNDEGKLRDSTFNSSLETKLIIHGYRAPGTKSSWINIMVQALLEKAQVNVVVVDWTLGAVFYKNAIHTSLQVSLEISAFINKLIALGSSESSFQLIGVSLGAHIAGFVGRFFEGRLGRITALDPAGPSFTHADVDERLDPTDAIFVEAIHTDTDNLGIRIPVGHIDYFVNGGKDQPGCSRFFSSVFKVYSYVICDHMRAVHLYISSVQNPCSLKGFPCSSYGDFISGNCMSCLNSSLLACPQIGLLERGGIKTNVTLENGTVFMMTKTTAPYCVHYFLLELHLKGETKVTKAFEITLHGNSISERVQLNLKQHPFCISDLSLMEDTPTTHYLLNICEEQAGM